ncbi:PREDICTED: uncharacterized protein LOC109231015 [Nicotiana attenuata]|uniref:Uncharacterized protein n=1 Tax=Nicotiana attenuata TaxID=49451 RepID=A0A1J6INR9_NICAT|nr:PREDICTED: uncharacterized protein LOC109231015 [Nicotiana attenuata]OIS99366.1 hypothetical protein A4A49_02241 [Nicotiana attenuata]
MDGEIQVLELMADEKIRYLFDHLCTVVRFRVSWALERLSSKLHFLRMLLIQEETVEKFSKDGGDILTLSLYQMDLDRTLFLLRSYLRTLPKRLKTMHFTYKSYRVGNRIC